MSAACQLTQEIATHSFTDTSMILQLDHARNSSTEGARAMVTTFRPSRHVHRLVKIVKIHLYFPHTALEMTLPLFEWYSKSEGTPRNLHIWTTSLPSFKIL